MKYQIGHVLKQKAAGREHTYTLTDTFQTVNRHGFAADVLVWAGSCATCGCSFETTGSRNGHRHLTRNCTAHRRKNSSQTRKSSSGISGPETCGRPAVDVRRMSPDPHPGD
jgi:hypothetical protein